MKKLDYIEVSGILYPDLHVNVNELGYFIRKIYKKLDYLFIN